MVSAIFFGWFSNFEKTLTIIQQSSQLVYSDKWSMNSALFMEKTDMPRKAG